MAEQKDTGPLELGAEMDYSEHDKTYDIFIVGSKYGTLICVALLVAMAAGFYASAGFIGGIAIFIISFFIGKYFMNKLV